MVDQSSVAGLSNPANASRWDGFVFVSRWQADACAAAFPLPPGRSVVLPSCIAPAIGAAMRTGVPPLSARAPVFADTSTPFRGLDGLLGSFPHIRAAVPETRLHVYSSMAVYQVDGAADPNAALYALCRSMDGVDDIGALSQAQLATAMQDGFAQFAQMIIWILKAARERPALFNVRQRNQMAHVLATGTWDARTRAWIDWLRAATGKD